MMNLIDLAKAITTAIPACKAGGAGWFLHQYTNESDWRKLPPPLRFQVEVLASQIRQLIPTDVHYTLSFDKRGASFGLEYSDGNTGTFGGAEYFETLQDIFAYLKEVDWDEFRGSKLQEMNVFDVLKEVADEHPINIPSSKVDAKKWAKQLAKVLAKVRAMHLVPPFVAIYANKGEPVKASTFESYDDLEYDMVNALTCQYRLLAILINGKELSFQEIEKRKLKAIDCLTPGSISRAKAEGRF